MVTVSALSLSCHLPVKLLGPVLPGQIPLNTIHNLLSVLAQERMSLVSRPATDHSQLLWHWKRFLK